jgi:hypothetical protein
MRAGTNLIQVRSLGLAGSVQTPGEIALPIYLVQSDARVSLL